MTYCLMDTSMSGYTLISIRSPGVHIQGRLVRYLGLPRPNVDLLTITERHKISSLCISTKETLVLSQQYRYSAFSSWSDLTVKGLSHAGLQRCGTKLGVYLITLTKQNKLDFRSSAVALFMTAGWL